MLQLCRQCFQAPRTPAKGSHVTCAPPPTPPPPGTNSNVVTAATLSSRSAAAAAAADLHRPSVGLQHSSRSGPIDRQITFRNTKLSDTCQGRVPFDPEQDGGGEGTKWTRPENHIKLKTLEGDFRKGGAAAGQRHTNKSE